MYQATISMSIRLGWVNGVFVHQKSSLTKTCRDGLRYSHSTRLCTWMLFDHVVDFLQLTLLPSHHVEEVTQWWWFYENPLIWTCLRSSSLKAIKILILAWSYTLQKLFSCLWRPRNWLGMNFWLSWCCTFNIGPLGASHLFPAVPGCLD